MRCSTPRPVNFHPGEATATIHRPHLIGAIIAKARAAHVPLDPNTDRHILDAAILAGLIRSSDRDDLDHLLAQPKHRHTLGRLVADLDAKPAVSAGERDSAVRGLSLLRRRLGRAGQ